MPDQPIKYNSQLEKDQSDDSANIVGKRSILYGWNSSTLLYERLLSTAGVLQTSGAGGGGGTQYAEGTTQATPTGTVAMGKNASNILHAFTVDGSGNLNVNLAAGSISGGNAAASATGSAVPASADYLGLKDGSGNLVGVTIGQQLAAASVPVILPSATVTSLTPPAAITNFANETGGNLATLAGIVTAAKAATKIADGDSATLGAKADAKSAATDTTSVSIMSVLKQISASVQAPPSQAVTNAGTFAVQSTPVTQADTFMLGGVNVKEINGVVPLMGAGNGGTGSLRVNVASDQVSIPVAATLGAETTKVIGTVNVAASQSIGVTQATGTNLHTVVDSGTVTTVSAVTAITNALPAGTNLLGKVGIDQTTPGTTNAVTPIPASNSGWTFDYQAGGLTATKRQLKASAGTFGGYVMLYNPNTAVTFIQVFNKASANVTVGTTAPDFVIPLPGIASASATGSAANAEIVMGIAMSTGITIAATTTETGLTSPSNNIFATFLYK